MSEDKKMSGDVPGAAGAGRKVSKSCPACGKPAVESYRPFCSRRCADLDLGRWLNGSYSIPAVEPPDGYDEAEPASGTKDREPG